MRRFKSWALWLAIASLITFMIKEFTGVDIGDKVNEVMNIALPILITFGIVNNPTDKNNF